VSPRRRDALRESQILRAIDGDPAAIEELALSFLPRIYGLALRLTRRKEVAEEATQETYLKLLPALPGLQKPERIDSWVLTIASNVVRDLMRTRGRSQPLTYEPPAVEAAEDDWELSRQRAVDHALGELSYAERELFLLHTVEGVRLKALARARQETLSAVTSRVHRVRTKVRAKALVYLRTAGAVS
jgi:RNA polymerase sigma-70 factor (ECF subfamily)